MSAFGGVWRRPSFRTLWAGQAVSMFGSLIGGFAFTLVAIISLHATPEGVAVLNGCTYLPGALTGPWIGSLADRIHRRTMLVTADVGRALVLASVPLAALTHSLTLWQLDVVAAIMSVLTMAFGVAFGAYTPSIVGADLLVQGNSVLRGTEAVAEAGGFALGGVLVQLLTAPVTIAFDALSFAVSAVSLSTIRAPEAGRPPDVGRRRSGDILDGARAIWLDPVLRPLTVTTFFWEVAGNAIGVVITLFFVRDLHLTPLALGPIFGVGGISAFLGAVVAPRVARRWGPGRSLIAGLYVDSLGLAPIAFAGGPLSLLLTMLVAGQVTDGGRTVYEINALSLLQGRSPVGKEGTVLATYSTLRSSAMLLGLVAGGTLGAIIGLRTVLVLALIAELVLVPLPLLASPLRRRATNRAPGLPG